MNRRTFLTAIGISPAAPKANPVEPEYFILSYPKTPKWDDLRGTCLITERHTREELTDRLMRMLVDDYWAFMEARVVRYDAAGRTLSASAWLKENV